MESLCLRFSNRFSKYIFIYESSTCERSSGFKHLNFKSDHYAKLPNILSKHTKFSRFTLSHIFRYYYFIYVIFFIVWRFTYTFLSCIDMWLTEPSSVMVNIFVRSVKLSDQMKGWIRKQFVNISENAVILALPCFNHDFLSPWLDGEFLLLFLALQNVVQNSSQMNGVGENSRHHEQP